MAVPARWTLAEIARELRRTSSAPLREVPRDPWKLILWENVAYLADDEGRATAFTELERSVGTGARELLEADRDRLLRVTSHGILPDGSVRKLRESAEILSRRFGGDPERLASLPTEELRKALREFPGIGAPGAERILVLVRRESVLPLDSNGLRVLTRIGYGVESRAYSTTYRSVQADLGRLRDDPEFLIDASERLRAHGKTICRRSHPKCPDCPLRPRCRTGSAIG